jgi:hypothetical protein
MNFEFPTQTFINFEFPKQGDLKVKLKPIDSLTLTLSVIHLKKNEKKRVIFGGDNPIVHSLV